MTRPTTATENGGTTRARDISPPDGTLPERSAIVFSDIVGSTRLGLTLGDQWTEVLTEHHLIVRAAFDDHNGFEAANQGDGFLYLFESAAQAARASIAAHQALLDHSAPTSIRIGLHWGTVKFSPGVGFFGIDLHRCARIADSALASQVLVSEDAAQELATSPLWKSALIDHGAHWLRDFREPEHLYSIATVGLTSDAPAARPTSDPTLPIYATALVARASALSELTDAIARADRTVTTVVGMGGVGKTRTTIEALRAVQGRPCHLVDLSHIEDSHQVLPEIARVLGVDIADDSLVTEISAELDRQHAVILIDNVEQVIDCAPDLSAIALAAEAATVLVTSRMPLRVANERVLELEPLSVGDGPQQSAAVELFCSITGADPDPATSAAIFRICEYVNGLPLGVELAAHQVDLLGISEIERQLAEAPATLTSVRRDTNDRHRSIESTVLWSYRLLDPDAQRVFRTLGEFPAGASVDSLATVHGTDRADVARSLSQLVDHRLVDRIDAPHRPSRFRMLRIIRDVSARELGDQGDRPETRRAIERLLADTARRSMASGGATRETEGYQQIVDEIDNFHHLFDDALTDDQALEPALRCASDLMMFWWHRHRGDGMRRLDELTRQPAASECHSYPRALVAQSILATYGGRPGRSIHYARAAVDVCRQRNRRGATFCTALQQVAAAESALGESDAAMAAVDEAEPVVRTLRDGSQAYELNGLGNVMLGENHVDRAEQAFADALALFERMDTTWLRAVPIARLGECALRRGDSARAEAHARDAIALWDTAPGQNGRSRAFSLLARVRWFQGDIDDARAIAHDAAAWAIELESPGDLPWALVAMGAVEVSSGNAVSGLRCFRAATELARAYAQPIHGVLTHELAPSRSAAEAAGPLTDWPSAQGRPVTIGAVRELLGHS